MDPKAPVKDISNIENEVIEHIQSQKPLWKQIMQSLKEKYGSEVCNTWFSKIEFAGQNHETNVIQLQVEAEFCMDWIKTNYGDSILKIAQSIDPSIEEIELSTVTA